MEEKKVIHSFNSFTTQTEYFTKKNYRIDIVIKSNEFVIGIENKINAQLNNDLNDYGNTIKSLAKSKEAYLIILSKNKLDISQEQKIFFKNQNILFHTLTYEKFIESIRNNIGYYQGYADTKYLIFLIDFLDNIEKNLNLIHMISEPEIMKFFLNKNEEIQRLINKHNQINNELYRGLNDLCIRLKK